MRPADLDIRTAFDMEKAAYHTAQRLAEQGAAMARQAGLEADGLAVADDVTVAETIAGWPANSTEQAVVLGNHGHGELRRLVLESTLSGVLREAPRPVLVGGLAHEGKE